MMSDGLFYTLFIGAAVLIVGILIGIAVGIDYYSACRKAEMFNRLNNTHWTCSDFYWAGDQINSRTITVQ